VDVNNLQQQIYVYGQMHWEGNIKFINSFPSQRRAGLFPLISILSVEKDGIIALKVGAVCTAVQLWHVCEAFECRGTYMFSVCWALCSLGVCATYWRSRCWSKGLCGDVQVHTESA
jgi:hypothetical protein